MRVVNEGEKDTEFDALPVEMMEPYDSAPVRARPDNPEFTRSVEAAATDSGTRTCGPNTCARRWTRSAA